MQARRSYRPPSERAAWGLGVGVLVGMLGCSGSQRVEGLDPATIPEAQRENYEVFAQRCSRCHSLARPLAANVNDLSHWREYIDRMRRQPGSGISPEDGEQVLSFFEYYLARRRAARTSGSEARRDAATGPSTDASALTPATPATNLAPPAPAPPPAATPGVSPSPKTLGGVQ